MDYPNQYGMWKRILNTKMNDIMYNMKNNTDLCYICNSSGEYWDWHNGMLVSVCKKHISIEVSS